MDPVSSNFQLPWYQSQEDNVGAPPLSSSSQKSRKRWSDEEDEILVQILQDPPKKEGTSNFDWIEITNIYNERIAKYNTQHSLVILPQRHTSSVSAHYRLITRVHECIQEEHLPKIVETIRKVYSNPTKYPYVDICRHLAAEGIDYTPEQIKNLTNNAKRLQDKPPLEDTLEKILQYQAKKTKKRPKSKESLGEPPKRIKHFSIPFQDHSTATTSAPQSISMDRPLSIDTKPCDAGPFCITSPVHAANPFTEAINSQLSPTSQTSLSSLPAFQFPLDLSQPSDPLQGDSEPESLELVGSEKEFLSLLE